MGIHLLPLVSPFIMIGLGLIGLRPFLSYRHRPLNRVTPLMQDATLAYMWRILSNVLQLLLYVTLAIVILSYGLFRHVPIHHLITGAIGTLGITLVSVCQLLVIPYGIDTILTHSATYPWMGLHKQFKLAASLSAFYGGILALLAWGCVNWMGAGGLLGFSMGVTLAAFYMRVSGGLLKGASKNGNELGIARSGQLLAMDRRNPGSFLEMLGGILGNGIGYQADLMGSLAFTMVSFYPVLSGPTHLFFPLQVVSMGFLACLPAYAWCRYRIQSRHFSNVYLEGIYITITLAAMGTWALLQHTGPLNGHSPMALFMAYVTGLLGAILIGFSSEWLTSNQFSPTKTIAYHVTLGGSQAMAKALENAFFSNSLMGTVLVLIASITYATAGLMGLSMGALGMVGVIVVIMTGNLSGPIASLATKAATIEEQSSIICQNSERIEGIAATTIAIRGGFASGAALLAAMALGAQVLALIPMQPSLGHRAPLFIAVGLLGLGLPYLMGSLISRSTRKATQEVIEEIIRQPREIPFLLLNKATPDIRVAVDRVSQRIMDGMILPGVLLLTPPLLLAFFADPLVSMALVVGAFCSVFNAAHLWWTLGDALYHTRQYIQSGHLGGKTAPTSAVLASLDQTGTLYRDVLSPSSIAIIKAMLMLTIVLLMIIKELS